MPDPQEQSLGRYRLVSLLGEGGMGKVYKGYDAALERHVAIKILPAELVADETRVSRFVQEARAASALNHPHVISVYDIGEDNGVRYIAMELVDGRTLRELALDALDIRKALKLVAQVAEALTAAHAAGIVHRDLKPDNIMVTQAGYAKVLDFGLAKLRIAEPRSDTSTTVARGTDPGVVMGTAGYMSPEQAQGKAVDHRSDIFSLGCVLYELVTGRRAFHGNSSVDTLHKIIYSDPEPVRALRPESPPELARIIRKALAKDPDERYQTARDFAIDVRDLLREIDSNPSGAAITAPVPVAAARPVWLFGVAALLVVAALAGAAMYLRRPAAAAHSAAAADPMRITRVTANGKVISAAISRDGQFVAYVTAEQGEQALWVRQMSSGQSLQLIAPSRRAYWGVAFAPDGSIYFGVKSDTERSGTMYQISALGGTPRQIITDIDSQPTFSPDGRSMAFLRARSPTARESSLVVANSDGTGARVLASVAAPDFFVPVFFAGAGWSPDGRTIATAVVNREKWTGRIAGVDSSSGAMRTIADHDWSQAGQAAWLPDQSALVAIAMRRGSTGSQVWYVTYPEGKATPITTDLFDYRMVSVTSDGNTILTVANDAASDVWIHPDGGAPKRITSGRLEGGLGVAAFPDGRIAFTSLETGKVDIWTMHRDGSGRSLVTRDEYENRSPVPTPDGKAIIYVSVTPHGAELCRINIDGSGRRVLAPTYPNARPDVSPDGRWVVFEHPDLSVSRVALVVARVPVEGGEPQILSDRSATNPTYSPDGTKIAIYGDRDGEGSMRLAIMPAEGGAPVQWFETQHPWAGSGIVWRADGKALVVNTAPSDRANLWEYSLDDPARPRRLTDFNERLMMGFARLPGDDGWVVSRGDLSRDAVMITNFRP